MRFYHCFLVAFFITISSSDQLLAQTAVDVDFNQNGTVDFPDFIAFAQAFGSSQSLYDLNENGTVDFPDFLYLARFFGQTAQPSVPPIANAGSDQGTDIKNRVILDGSASTAPEGNDLQYIWTQVFGDNVSLSDSTTVQPSFMPPSAGNYAFQLEVSNRGVKSQPDTVLINVITLSDQVVLIGDKNNALTFRSIVGNQLTLGFTDATSTPEIGNILVHSETPYFLKRVVSIELKHSDHIILNTESAVLNDVIKEASFTATFRTNQPNSAKLSIPAQASLQIPENTDIGVRFDQTSLHSDASVVLSANGNIAFDPEYQLVMEIRPWGLKYFKLSAGGRLLAALEMNLNAQASFEREVEKIIATVPIKPFEIILPTAVRIKVGIQGEFSIGASFSSDAKGSLQTGIEVVQPMLIGAEYKGREWQALFDPQQPQWNAIGPDVQLEGKTGLQVYVQGQINVSLYDAPGIFFGLKPYLGFDAGVNLTEKQITASLIGGMDGFVGAKLDLIGRDPIEKQWDFNLVEKNLITETYPMPSYRILGSITESGIPLPNVQMTLFGVTSDTVTTDATGQYTFSEVIEGTYTIVPSQMGYSFAPGSINIDISDADVTEQNFTVTSTPADQPGRIPNMTFVTIGPGKFMMGTPDTSRYGNSLSDRPQHEVTISHGFNLGKYEVTQEQWKIAMGTTPWMAQESAIVNPNHPAVYVSWLDVQAFVQTLNTAAKDSLFRLPTEAEWEYAGRAGTTTTWSFGDEESRLGDHAWFSANTTAVGEAYAHEVGTKRPNPWGLFDMHGNVLEWMQDDGRRYSNEAQTDPGLRDTPSSSRIVRSSGFDTNIQFTYSGKREAKSKTRREANLGFRVAKLATPVQGPSISGIITESDTALSGVRLILNGRMIDSLITDIDTLLTDTKGTYIFPDLQNSPYKITPFKKDYRFSPRELQINVNDMDFVEQNLTGEKIQHDVSGQIAEADTGLSNVQIALSGLGTRDTLLTDSDGRYRFPSILEGTYRLTPSHEVYEFSPDNLSIDVDGKDLREQNFKGKKVIHTVSGRILFDNIGLRNVKVMLDRDSTFTDGEGAYHFSGIRDGFYTVTPSKVGYKFPIPAFELFEVEGEDVIIRDFVAETTHAIYGRITESGQGLEDVQVTLSVSERDTVITDAEGYYWFLDLSGDFYSVTPFKEGYNFSPRAHHLLIKDTDFTDQNFNGKKDIPPPDQVYTLSVRITESGTGLGDVEIILGGGATDTVATDSGGVYQFIGLRDTIYTVTPSKTGYVFSPAVREVRLPGANVVLEISATRDLTLDPPDSLTTHLSENVTMDFVYVAPGTFTMGSADSGSTAFGNEGPQHQVTITKGFYLGKNEVTQGQWEAVMGTRPWEGKDAVQEHPDNPAVYISWDDVRLFIHAANLAAKRMIYRFPTESEWEYACRAGTTTAWSFGNDENQLTDYAWYIENATNINEDYAHQVGLKKPNPWGLYDMHGNVAEWVLDGYDPYPSKPQTDPKHGLGSPLHVIRSGYFGSFDKFTRSAYRFPGIPNSEEGYRGPDTGFRLVRVAE